MPTGSLFPLHREILPRMDHSEGDAAHIASLLCDARPSSRRGGARPSSGPRARASRHDDALPNAGIGESAQPARIGFPESGLRPKPQVLAGRAGGTILRASLGWLRQNHTRAGSRRSNHPPARCHPKKVIRGLCYEPICHQINNSLVQPFPRATKAGDYESPVSTQEDRESARSSTG